MYILDTSALKGIGKSRLEVAKQNHDLAISPLTFYELLCHLDETHGGKTFERQRGYVMKCTIPRILHDPFAYHAIAVGAEHVTNESRFEEPNTISQLLMNLGNASDLNAFYSSTVKFSNGDVGRCRDIADNVRRVLKAEEDRYTAQLILISTEVQGEFSDCATVGLSPQQLASLIAASLKKMIADYRTKDGIIDDYLATKVTSSMYMHLGYQVARVVEYLQNAREGGTTFNPDPNDCEDSYITMYLELFNRDALVTGDTGTLNALKATKDAFLSVFDGSLQIESRVLSNEDFVAEIGIDQIQKTT